MRLFKTGENEQNAYYKWVSNRQKYISSWKDEANNKTIAVSKFIQNSLPDNIKTATNNCGFIANPIKHHRKQYISFDANTTGFSSQSYIGSLDKPGSENFTTVDCDTLQQIAHKYIIDMRDMRDSSSCYLTSSTKKCGVIKPATTVINSEYSQSHRALLHKRCKTIGQNLPLTKKNTTFSVEKTEECKTLNKCMPVFAPSNTKYQVQGPLSSSARISAIKYCAQDLDGHRCKLPTTNFSITQQLHSGRSIATTVPCATHCFEYGPGKKRYGTRVL